MESRLFVESPKKLDALALGVEANWEHNPDHEREALRVEIRRQFDLTDSESWEETYKWLLETYETFHKVFSSKITSLVP